ncbi:ApbE family protein [Capnocytophaga gingivalis ATCC 33624]|uniref:FAD:protein FMN transferase n=1 Tax=Capnocytophaga gingivalis TaxID=1017 RepID=UPI00019FBA1E|nr:FAD:protein FMN transferase [Capnocytophaga gingivalis]EEK13856.1 ApbE family protein [Capnocytophaga gingivalis ATCC 33624]
MKYLYTLCIAVLVTACGTTPKENVYYIKGEAQGTTYSITYIAKAPVEKTAIDSILQVIDLSMSTYIDNSLISRINRGENLPIDPHFEKVFSASFDIYWQSKGAFDPSIGQLINAWGFGKKENHTPPTQKQIDSLLALTGMDKVHYIDTPRGAFIKKDNPNIQLNFNAIAQGYTSDVIAEYFLSKQISNFIVEVGGELVIHGRNTLKNKPWRIGIDNPLQKPDEDREIVATVELTDCGLATSGNYRKLWTDSLTGQKYVHTINPKTGRPQPSNLLSATVIAPSAMLADGYATTLMALGGIEKAKDFLAQHKELKAVLLYSDEAHKGQIQKYVTENLTVEFESQTLSEN